MAFFATYLLHSLHPSAKPRAKTYIGYTVNPPRRLRQHNGEIEGGARRTRLKRPWEMVCAVYGFPTKTSALQFEAAWTYPRHSRFLRECRDAKGRTYTNSVSLKSRMLVLHALLAARPWCTYSLSLHFLKEDFWALAEAYECEPLPSHVPIILGNMEVLQEKVGASAEDIDVDEDEDEQDDEREGYGWSDSDSDAGLGLDGEASGTANPNVSTGRGEGEVAAAGESAFDCDCVICLEPLEGPRLTCTQCSAHAHVLCLADWFTGKEARAGGLAPLLPTKGTCPGCRKRLVWGVLVRRMHSIGTGAGTAKAAVEVEVDSESDSEIAPLAARLAAATLEDSGPRPGLAENGNADGAAGGGGQENVNPSTSISGAGAGQSTDGSVRTRGKGKGRGKGRGKENAHGLVVPKPKSKPKPYVTLPQRLLREAQAQAQAQAQS